MSNPQAKASRTKAEQEAHNALNEEFNTLLRDGAQAREDRARASASLERAAADREARELLALARRPIPGAGARPSRGWIKG